MAEGGWIGVCIPTEYGGGGQGITEATVILEEVARSGAGMNGCSAIHLSIFGMNPVVKYGSEQQQQEYLPAVAEGSLHVAFGVTEPDAGTDTSSITTKATLSEDGTHYTIRGRKVWTTKAPYCQKVLLLTRTTPRDQVEAPDRRHDPVAGRSAAPRGHDHPHPQGRPQRGGELRGGLRRSGRCRSRTASVRRAWASPTCSTG